MRRQRQAQWQARIQDDFKDKSDAHVEINVGNFKPFSNFFKVEKKECSVYNCISILGIQNQSMY
jgi:hypothetical protein